MCIESNTGELFDTLGQNLTVVENTDASFSTLLCDWNRRLLRVKENGIVVLD